MHHSDSLFYAKVGVIYCSVTFQPLMIASSNHYLGHCITYTYIQYMSGTYGRAVLISALSSNFSTVIVNNTCILNHMPAEAFSTTLSPTIKIFLRTMNEITNVHKQNNIHLRRKVHFFQRLKLYRDLKTEK